MDGSARATDHTDRRPWRRYLAVAGVAVAAIVAGGFFALLLSGRDDARPLAAEASPTPTATVQTPSPTASPSASPSPSATPAQTPEPTATPPPVSDTDAWIGPERIATRDYGELSLVVDEEGIAHAAAELDNAIYYLTNATGSWTREPLTTPPDGGHDGDPAMVLDRDGSLAVVFVRYRSWGCYEVVCFPDDPDGAYVVSNASGSWSAPSRVPVEAWTPLPSKAVGVRDGALHVAYELHAGDGRDRASVWYATNRTGTWTAHHVADDSTPLGGPAAIQVPLDPSLALAADGTPRITFGSNERPHYAAATGTGGFTVESVGDAAWGGGNRPPTTLLTLDSLDRPHIVYTDSDGASRYVHRSGNDWSTPELTFPGTPADRCGLWSLNAIGMALSERGTVHVASRHTTIFFGLWSASNRGGNFEARQIWPPEIADDPCDVVLDSDPRWPTAMAGDSAGRLHILFTIGDARLVSHQIGSLDAEL